MYYKLSKLQKWGDTLSTKEETKKLELILKIKDMCPEQVDYLNVAADVLLAIQCTRPCNKNTSSGCK